MLHNYAEVAGAVAAGALDVLGVGEVQHRGAHKARVAGHAAYQKRPEQVFNALAQRHYKHEYEQHPGYGGDDVKDAHDDVVQPAAEIAAGRAYERADGEAERRCEKAYGQRIAAAVYDARKEVAPYVVRPEGVLGAGRQTGRAGNLLHQRGVNDKVREYGHKHDGAQQHKPYHGRAVLAEKPPYLAPAAALDGAGALFLFHCAHLTSQALPAHAGPPRR